MNQVMPICSVVMIIHVVLLDWVMNYLRGLNMNQLMSMSIVVMIIHVVMNFRGVNMNQVISHVHCGHDYSCCSAGLCDEFQRSEYEPSDANVHCGHDYSCCSAGLCDEYFSEE